MEVYPALVFPAQCLLFLTYACLLLFLCLFPTAFRAPLDAPLCRWCGSARSRSHCCYRRLSGRARRGLARADNPRRTTHRRGRQIYRYARVSDPLQRQQTKWVVFGISVQSWGRSFPPRCSSISSLAHPDRIDGASLTTWPILPASLSLPVYPTDHQHRCTTLPAVGHRRPDQPRPGLRGAHGERRCTLRAARGRARGSAPGAWQPPISLLATGLVAGSSRRCAIVCKRAVNRLMYGERDDPYEVLSRLGERLKLLWSPSRCCQAVAETVAQALKLPTLPLHSKRTGKGAKGLPRPTLTGGLTDTVAARLPA